MLFYDVQTQRKSYWNLFYKLERYGDARSKMNTKIKKYHSKNKNDEIHKSNNTTCVAHPFRNEMKESKGKELKMGSK